MASGDTGKKVGIGVIRFISLPETTSRSSEVLVDEILTVTHRATKRFSVALGIPE